MQTLQLDLPAHWASALINGDESGLDDNDQKCFDRFVDWIMKEYGSCLCIDFADGETQESDFRRYHDATDFGVLACDVATFTFDITQR